MREYTEQELVRREKAKKLLEKNIDPFGSKYDITSDSKTIKELYSEFTNEELEEKDIEVSVAGRIMTKRGKGKAGFMHIQDKTGLLQVYCRLDNMSEVEYDVFKKGDIGDIVGVYGQVIKTDTGEITIKASKYTHLSKALKLETISDISKIIGNIIYKDTYGGR